MTRTGRRGGDTDTREEILAAARALFAEDGFDATSLRAVARSADVDPALVHHYFDGKGDLFAQAFALPVDLTAVAATLADGPADGLGERLVHLFLAIWSGPGRDHMIGILRSALTHDTAAAMLREFITATILDGVAGVIGGDDAATRAALCGSQLVGIAMLRHILGFAPLQELSDEDLVAVVAPTLQRYLTGPLPS